MGGIGSGRIPGLGRDTVEGCRALDVNLLQHKGCLKPGSSGGWSWFRDGEKIAGVRMLAEEDRLILVYRYGANDGEKQDVVQGVPIERMTCRFGGTRPYFRCTGRVNGIACRRRVAKLYLGGRYFLCRHCYRLAYSSQTTEVWERARWRLEKLRIRLGGDPYADHVLPPRPKGMWRRTYERICSQIRGAEARAEEAYEMRLCELIGNPTDQGVRRGSGD